MKIVIHNNDNLKEEEITEVVLRAKAVLLNNENILLANEDNVLQFPGGHVEEGEKLETCLKREILEETGIEIEDSEIGKCFQKVIFMNKDWPSAGKNRKCEIYYYEVKTNKLPDLSKVHLTESEKNQHFKVDFIPLKDSIKYIKDNMPKAEKNKVISPDMIEALEEYIKGKNNNE